MSEWIDEPEVVARLRGQLEDLCDLDEGLSDWEVQFVEDLVDHFEMNDGCTRKQADKIDELYERHC